MGTDTKLVRKLAGGITQAQLAERYSIPIRTVQNWDQRACMPLYVEGLILKDIYSQELLERHRKGRNNQSNEKLKMREMLK